MNELGSAIYSKLSAGTALTAQLATMTGGTTPAIFNQRAPKEQSYPYVVYNWQAGGQTADHDIVSGLEWVRAYGTAAIQAGSAYAAFDALLNGGTMTVSGWSTLSLRREDQIELVEDEPDGSQVYTCGAFYRVILDK